MDEENELFEELGEGEESLRSESIHYNTEDFISTFKSSEDGTVPHNILEFQHSFGYDCRKRFNLCAADTDTLIFASGNLIHIFKVSSKELTFRRCSTGGGIGHITKNPKFEVLAIGENGTNPPIIIYEWPSLEIITVLRTGTTRSFSHLRFSPDGALLVSQGGDPDYLITVWDWQNSKIRLQCKSHGQDVYNVVFSRYLAGHMTSCGAGHIKCWKMAETFTGLKLQGELGRFGKTEISDILGVYPMPDEKVVSGCEWGNILVWNEGLIKIEVCRKNQRPCHDSYVSQLELVDEDLISVGTDGYIRFWYYETIDQAEPTEDSHYCDVEPIYEIRVDDSGNENTEVANAKLLQMVKKDLSSEEDSLWYAQDGNGGIWLIDLVPADTVRPPEKLLTCHAGKIVDMDLADWGPYAATMDADGYMHVYNYEDKSLKLRQKFRDTGSCVVWLSCLAEPTGCAIACGFSTGVIRMVLVNLTLDTDNKLPKENENVALLEALKPHTQKITCMKTNPTNRVLVTGSEDLTVFVFQIETTDTYPSLVPIGYIGVPSCVTFMTWKPETATTLFVGCLRGDCMLVDVPEEPQKYTTTSLRLTQCKPIEFKFQSVKSSILREEVRAKNEAIKAQKIMAKREELKELLESNPGMEVDEQTFLESDLGEDAPLPELYIPEVPNAVLGAFFTQRNTVMLLMSGYDAGYVYEYSCPDTDEPAQNVRNQLIADCEGKEIQTFCFYNDRKYAIFGMEDGAIRVCRVNSQDDADFSDYWILSMHDNMNGRVTSMRLSTDERILLTCGHDGNVFSYTVNDDSPPEIEVPIPTRSVVMPDSEVAVDIDDLDQPSLEEVVVKIEYNRVMLSAKDEKESTLARLRQLNEVYNQIMKRNSKLPESQRFADSDFVVDQRITDDLTNMLKDQMDLVYKQLAFDEEKSKVRLKKLMDHFIEPITCMPFAVKRLLKPETKVYSLRELKLTGDYAMSEADLMRDADSRDVVVLESSSDLVSTAISESIRTRETYIEEFDDETESPKTLHNVESFLKGLSPRTIKQNLGAEINQMLKRYRILRSKLEEQENEWKILMSEKPDPKAANPEDELVIEEAKSTIGDYKLKANLEVDENPDKRLTVERKYHELIRCRRKIHYRRENFNHRLRGVREKKLNLKKEVEVLTQRLKGIHAELPPEFAKPLPEPIMLDQEIEFPENNLKLEIYTSVAERVREMKKMKQTVELDASLQNFDEEYEVLLLDESHFRPRKASLDKKKSENVKVVRNAVAPDVLAALKEAENTDSPLERELKRARATRKLHEQDQILTHLHKCYAALDSELDELELERVQIVYESVYMHLYLLTMHQEYIVLKKFENKEKALTKTVDNVVNVIAHVDAKIRKLNSRISEKNAVVKKLTSKIKEITTKYLDSIAENKFAVFLRKIFRKKFVDPQSSDESSSPEPSPKARSFEELEYGGSEGSETARQLIFDDVFSDRDFDDDAFVDRSKKYESVEKVNESSQLVDTKRKRTKLENFFYEDEDDDGASDDSETARLRLLDESILPEGCDQSVYDKAFAVREQRWTMESRIKDELRNIEALQKDLDVQIRRKRVKERELGEDRKKLESLLAEKQSQLNDIDITIVLKLSQLQCFIGNNAEKIQNCIVLDKARLSQLYARVGELQQEIADQLEMHKSDRAHLKKMENDCESMKQELKKVKQEIKKEMEQKFGQQISLVNLYESVLRRLVYEIKANTSNLIKFYDDKIKVIKTQYTQQLQVLNNLIQDNTEKLSFLTVLEEELTKIKKALNAKVVSEEELCKMETQYSTDLCKLKTMLKNQEMQKDLIRKDIRTLSHKSRNLAPIEVKLKTDKEKRRPKLTFDGSEHDMDYQRTCLMDNLGFTAIDDSEYYKKIIAVRHLLSQLSTAEKTNTKETIKMMLEEISVTMQQAGYSQEEIDKNISDIIDVSYEGYSQEEADVGEFTDLPSEEQRDSSEN